MRNLAAFLLMVTTLAAWTHGAEKPNLIFILIDDMGYGDIGPFGSKLNKTPQLDRMAKEGMKLTSFYAAPVCTPSRAQVLTGCYAKRVSLPNVIAPASQRGLSAHEHSIAELLKKQGYATMAIGKWHVGDSEPFLPLHHGFDHYFGLPYSNDMKRVWKGAAPTVPLMRDDRIIEYLTEEKQDFLTRRYTEEAIKFITTNKDHPFFLYMPHTAVHTPIHPGPDFQGKSGIGRYNDWVQEVDWSVGQVLATLKQLGLDRNTLVLFSSDNGPWLSKGKDSGTAGPLRGGKFSTWEGGVREPSIAWWPGKVPAGTSSDVIMANFDLLPTFVKLAGGTIPKDKRIDGVDLWPVLSGASQQQVHEAHYYFAGKRLEAVRSGPWKLAVTNQGGGQSNPAGKGLRLYDLEKDLGETTNVADQHPDIVKKLQGLIAVMDRDLGRNDDGPGVRPPGHVEKDKVVYPVDPVR